MAPPHETTVSRAIKNFAGKEQPTLLEWNHLKVLPQVQLGLVKYEAQAQGMTFEQLIKEEHKPDRLARHMAANGNPRPHPLCDCHAIIAGKDPRSEPFESCNGVDKNAYRLSSQRGMAASQYCRKVPDAGAPPQR